MLTLFVKMNKQLVYRMVLVVGLMWVLIQGFFSRELMFHSVAAVQEEPKGSIEPKGPQLLVL